jgi:hypothetical protein
LIPLWLLASTALAQTPATFDRSDSAFLPDESHAVTEVTEGQRRGWSEHKDTVRFGAYSFSVTQRRDPATGLPAQQGQVWGDAFVGIGGKKPAFYMASNWSPWDFLGASVRLDGDAADQPQPTKCGLLVYLGLREVTGERIVADAVFRDAAGGTLSARFVGRRGTDRFGLRLSYDPPKGRQVASLRYTLVCQPYDYSDRGHWQRRRWVTTPARDYALAEGAPLEVKPAAESLFVFHNRFAQNDAGTLLAVDPTSVAAVSLTGHGNTIAIDLTPTSFGAPVYLLLGDWIDEAYGLAAGRFFASAAALTRELTDLATLQVPRPPEPAPVEDQEIDALLARSPALAQEFADKLRQVRAELAAAHGALGAEGEPSAEALTSYSAVLRSRSALYQDARAASVKTQQWPQR